MTATSADKATSRASKRRLQTRDYAMFDSELSGAVLNMHLLGRLMSWLKPYRIMLFISALLILLASVAVVIMEVVISRVLVDYIIIGEKNSVMPDLGMIDFTIAVQQWLGVESIYAAGVIFAFLLVLSAVAGHAHRLTLISAIVKSLRDLRQDLFSHLETRPSSFFDRVPVGRIMTRVTNDIEALYEMLRGMGGLIGEFVPFFVALAIMLSTSVELTLILLLLVPVVGVATYFFRQASVCSQPEPAGKSVGHPGCSAEPERREEPGRLYGDQQEESQLRVQID
jgi:ATP-binding cassette subfamily B protein